MPKTLLANPSQVTRVFTGSMETEQAIKAIVDHLAQKGDKWDQEISERKMKEVVDNDLYIKVLHTGRAGPGEIHEGSTAADDIGGYLIRSGEGYKVTHKLIESCENW